MTLGLVVHQNVKCQVIRSHSSCPKSGGRDRPAQQRCYKQTVVLIPHARAALVMQQIERNVFDFGSGVIGAVHQCSRSSFFWWVKYGINGLGSTASSTAEQFKSAITLVMTLVLELLSVRDLTILANQLRL